MGAAISGLVFQPPPDATIVPAQELIWLPRELPGGAADGEAACYEIPAYYIDNGHKTTVVFSHGNAEDLGASFAWFKDMSMLLKVNFFAYEYTGYGMSRDRFAQRHPGRKDAPEPSEEGCYGDMRAAVKHLTEVLKVAPGDMVLYGRSLGSGPSVQLAMELSDAGRPPCGLILQSGLLSIYRVSFNFRFSLPGDSFENVHKIGRVGCPVFIMHGTEDAVVPFWHGQELYRKVRPDLRVTPFWAVGAGHNDIEMLLTMERSLVPMLRDRIGQMEASRDGQKPAADGATGSYLSMRPAAAEEKR